MKEEIIKLALDKDIDFKSTFLYNRPFKYSTRENSRWLFWLTELQQWLRDNHNINYEYCRKLNISKWDFIIYDMALNGKEYIKYYRKYKELHPYRKFDSYELAFEAGMLEALELLKSRLI